MIIVELLLVSAVLAAIGYPLFVQPKSAVRTSEDGDEYHKLIAKKEAAFVALKDLDFDHKTGKIDDADFDQLKARYEDEAVAVLKRIDGVGGASPAFRKASGGEQAGIFCTSCGTQAKAGDRFCGNCGAKLSK
ncbi:MAG: zinc ribbon domain-containing protein [Nitrospinae bacterium]|nr:zinc ribbon domain-containing protein [Nitrospinota bacterium]